MKGEKRVSKKQVLACRTRKSVWHLALLRVDKLGSSVYRHLNDFANRVLHLEGKVEASLGLLMLLSFTSVLFKGAISNLSRVFSFLDVIVSVLKYFAPFMTGVLILRTIFSRQRPGIQIDPDVIDTLHKDHRKGYGFTTKVLKRSDLPLVVEMADRVFGTIRRKHRHELFLAWHVAKPNTIRQIKKDGRVVGYAICLPLDPATAVSHMSSDLSQYAIKGVHIRSWSNTVYIQAVFVEREFQREAGLLMIQVLYGMIKSFIEDEHQPITIYFEESSHASARWGVQFGFQPRKRKSREGRRIWVLRISSLNDFQIPRSGALERVKRSHLGKQAPVHVNVEVK